MRNVLAFGIVIIFIAALFEAGYGMALDTLPRSETLYVVSDSSFVLSANPFEGSDIIGLDGLIFEPLFMLNFMTGELKPWLAESGKWIKPNVFEVRLRPGLNWQDGRPLTAEDVKFSYEYYQEIGLRNWTKLGLKEIKVVDNRTVDFIFNGTPNYQLWKLQLFYGWGQGALVLPEHIFKNLNPKNVTRMTFFGDEQKYLIGSGAYKLYKAIQGQKAILIRNDNWWGNNVFGRPAPKYIVQLCISSKDRAFNMSINGDFDIGNYYFDIVQAKKRNPYLVSWLDKSPYFPPVAPVLLYFNTKKPPMNNPEFRRAIVMAINPKQITKNGPIGGMPSEIPFGTGLLKKWSAKISLDDLIKEYGWQYGNIAEANNILDRLGMKRDSSGWRTYNGREIVLHLVTCVDCSDWISAAKIIQNQLSDLGIKVIIDKCHWGTMMEKYTKGDFDLGIHWTGTFQPTAYAVYNALLSKDGVANFGNFTDPQAQQILNEFAKTTDPNKEAQYIKELSEIWLKEVPAVPVYMATLFYEANTKYWTNWPNANNPYGIPIFWAKYGTWGTALALLGVKSAGTSLSTSSTVVSTSPPTTHTTSAIHTTSVVSTFSNPVSTSGTISTGTKTTFPSTLTHAQTATSSSSKSTTSSTVAISTSRKSSPPQYILAILSGLAIVVAVGVGLRRRGGRPSTGKTGEPTSAVSAPTLPGFPSALLSRYEPLELLGEGGFAKVFKAKRKKDGKIVALKIPMIDERTSKTFLREVSTWLQLNHPNIVKLHDVDILPVPYLEMEFVEGTKVNGRTVRDLCDYPKPVDEGTALRLIRGIAAGLKHAHSKGIYHRDLKPGNVLLKSDLTPKITDWGLAKVDTMSSSRSVLGYTPLYAAPEHLMPGKYGHTDHRTDIWQLGVVFYELLTGRLPFEGYTSEEVYGKITDESYRFEPPSRINPELAKYDGIFERLLAKRKEDRYGSVDEFIEDLKRLEETESRKAEVEREVEELKKTLAMSIEALKKSRNAEEALRNRRMVVESLGKLVLAYAELNRKADLLNTLNDLKFYTVQNLNDLSNAINTVELLIKENVPVGGDLMERLKVLVHNMMRENGV